MKDIPDPANGRDDIDRIVDALLEHPDQASDLKDLLRNKLSAPEVVRVVAPARNAAKDDDPSASDDFWDNVPV